MLCDVVGLKARADLNSCRARILCYLPDKQRYTVQLLSARVFGTKINIKPANLRIDEGTAQRITLCALARAERAGRAEGGGRDEHACPALSVAREP